MKELQQCNAVEHTVTDDGERCLCGYFIRNDDNDSNVGYTIPGFENTKVDLERLVELKEQGSASSRQAERSPNTKLNNGGQ